MNELLHAALGADLAASAVSSLFLVFLRVGTALMLMPGFSEAQVLQRFRLGFAFVFSLVLGLSLGPAMPSAPASPGDFLLLAGGEIVIGLLIGFASKLAMAVIHLAGAVMAMQSGLSASSFFDPSDTSQRTIFSSFLSMAAVTLILSGDGQYWLIGGLRASYDVLPPGQPLPMNDLMELLTRLSSQIFLIGLQIAAPIAIIGLITNLAFGLLNRMMPSMQVLTVAMPAQLLLGLAATSVTVGTALLLTMHQLERGTLWLVHTPIH